MGEVAVLTGKELEQTEIESYLLFLRQVVTLALGQLVAGPNWEVSVSLVGDGEMQKLNRQWRGIDRTTDVLSFPMLEEWEEGPNLLGDIVISLPVATRQAQEYGHSLLRELAFLAVHGILHLLGRDHENDLERELMEREQNMLLCALGLGR